MRVGRDSVASLLAVTLVAACSPRGDSSAARAVQQSGRGQTSDLLTAAKAVYDRAEYDSARSMYERTERDAQAAGDSVRLAQALTGQAFTARHQSRLDDAKSIAERALEIDRRLGDQGEAARMLNTLGLI